jgi:hypothetical protein
MPSKTKVPGEQLESLGFLNSVLTYPGCACSLKKLNLTEFLSFQRNPYSTKQ